MPTQRVSPAAIVALREALTNIYWYKADLRSFLSSVIHDPALLARLNWEDYKRNIVGSLLSYLDEHQATQQQTLVLLMEEVSRFQDFRHLEMLDDGKVKAAKAAQAVAAVQAHIDPHVQLITEQRDAEVRRQDAYRRSLENQTVQGRLSELNKLFFQVISPTEPHQRGYKLERLLRDLFELFDLDPRAAFALNGEQIDGSFTFDNTDYILEARWRKEQAAPKDLSVFKFKVETKLENTLGLFLSINGFSEAAVDMHERARPSMILADGSDLMAVLEGRIDLLELLLRKRRHAAQTGGIFLPVHRILS